MPFSDQPREIIDTFHASNLDGRSTNLRVDGHGSRGELAFDTGRHPGDTLHGYLQSTSRSQEMDQPREIIDTFNASHLDGRIAKSRVDVHGSGGELEFDPCGLPSDTLQGFYLESTSRNQEMDQSREIIDTFNASNLDGRITNSRVDGNGSQGELAFDPGRYTGDTLHGFYFKSVSRSQEIAKKPNKAKCKTKKGKKKADRSEKVKPPKIRESKRQSRKGKRKTLPKPLQVHDVPEDTHRTEHQKPSRDKVSQPSKQHKSNRGMNRDTGQQNSKVSNVHDMLSQEDILGYSHSNGDKLREKILRQIVPISQKPTLAQKGATLQRLIAEREISKQKKKRAEQTLAKQNSSIGNRLSRSHVSPTKLYQSRESTQNKQVVNKTSTKKSTGVSYDERIDDSFDRQLSASADFAEANETTLNYQSIADVAKTRKRNRDKKDNSTEESMRFRKPREGKKRRIILLESDSEDSDDAMASRKQSTPKRKVTKKQQMKVSSRSSIKKPAEHEVIKYEKKRFERGDRVYSRWVHHYDGAFWYSAQVVSYKVLPAVDEKYGQRRIYHIDFDDNTTDQEVPEENVLAIEDYYLKINDVIGNRMHSLGFRPYYDAQSEDLYARSIGWMFIDCFPQPFQSAKEAVVAHDDLIVKKKGKAVRKKDLVFFKDWDWKGSGQPRRLRETTIKPPKDLNDP